MDDSSTVISVSHVSKSFYLPQHRAQSVKRILTTFMRTKNKSIELQRALNDINIEIKEGEFFGILGRNGSGKSTLLKILAGIYQPSTGKVRVRGKLVPFIELGVGFNPELTGRENVYLNGAMLGFSQKQVEAMYDSIVKFAELERFMDQKLKNYSSGMQVRLAFSMAVRAEADILLVDEVLAVGDADFQRKCYDYFKSLKKQKKTVVFVTHDMGAVREFCDRAILIDASKKTHEGSADEIADEYLKMFNEKAEVSTPDNEEDIESEASNQQRWGNGKVSFRSIKAKVHDDKIVVTIALEAKEDVGEVIVGLRVKDADGALIGGGNTRMYLGKGVLVLNRGETKTLTYSFARSLFGGGTRSVGASIKLSDKVTVCDDWEAASSFTIVGDQAQSYYPVILPAEVSLD